MNIKEIVQSIFFIVLVFVVTPVLLINIYAFAAEILTLADNLMRFLHKVVNKRKQ